MSALTPTAADREGARAASDLDPQEADQLAELVESDAVAIFSFIDKFKFARWRRRTERDAKRNPQAYLSVCRSHKQP
jgi:hypothetical protein